MAAAQQINIDAFNDLEKKIQSVYGALVKLDLKLDAGVIKRFIDLATGVNQFSNALSRLAKISEEIASAQVVKIRDFFKELATLDAAIGKAGRADLTIIDKYTKDLTKIITQFGKIKSVGVEDVGVGLANFFKKLESALNSASKLKLSPKTLESLQDLRKVVSDFSKVEIGTAAGSAIGRFFDSLSRATAAAAKIKLGDKVFDTLENMRKIVSKFADLGKDLNPAESSDKIAAFFIGIAKATTVIDTISLKKDALETFKTIGKMIEVFSSFKRENGTEAVASLAATFGTIQSFIATLGDTVGKISVVTILKINKLLPSILPIIETIGTLLSKFSGKNASAANVTAAADGYEKALAAVGAIIKTFGETVGGLKISVSGKALIQPIVEIFKSVTTITELASKENGGANAADISKIFESIGAIFGQIAGLLGSSVFAAATGFKDVAGRVAGLVISLGAMSYIFSSITALVRKAKGVEAAALVGLGKIFEGLAVFFDVFVNFNTKVADLVARSPKEAIKTLAVQFATFAVSLGTMTFFISRILNLVKGFDAAQTEALGGFLKGIAAVFTSVADLMATLAKNQTNLKDNASIVLYLKNVVLTLTPLGLALFAITTAVSRLKGVDPGVIKGFGDIIQGAASVLDIVSNLLNKNVQKVDSIFSFIKYIVQVELALFPLKSILGAVGNLIQSTANINPAAIAGFGAIFTGLASFFHAFVDFNKIITESLKGTLADGLKEALIRVAAFAATLGGLLFFVKKIVDLVAGRSAEETKAVASYLNGIGNMLTGIARTLRVVLENLPAVDSIKGLILYIVNIELAIYPINKLLGAVSGLVASSAGVDPSSINSLASILESTGKLFTLMLTSLGSVQTGITGIKSLILYLVQVEFAVAPLIRVFGAVQGLILFARKVEPGALAGVAGILQGIGEFFTAYVSFTGQISKAAEGGLGSLVKQLVANLISMGILFGTVGAFIRLAVRATADVGVDKLNAIAEFMKGIGSVFTGLGSTFRNVSKDLFDIGSIPQIIKVVLGIQLMLLPIRSLVTSVLKSVKGTDAATLDSLAPFLRAVAAVLGEVSKVFRDVSIEDFGVFRIIKTLALFNGIVKPIKEVGKIISSLPKNGNFTGAAEYITAISEFLTKIFTTFVTGDTVIDPGKIKNIKNSVEQVVKILSAIKLPKTATDGGNQIIQLVEKFDKLSNIDQSFANLAAAMNDLTKIDANTIGPILETVGKGIGDFIAALGEISTEKLQSFIAISELFKSIFNLSSGAGSGGGIPKDAIKSVDDAGNAAKDTADGFQEAGDKVSLFQRALDGVSGIANLIGQIPMAVGSVVSTLDAIGQRVDRFITQIKAAFDGIKNLGTGIKDFGTNLINNFGLQNIANTDAFKATVDFDKIGSSLQVFGGLTEEQRKKAEDFANVLGKDYPISANEALKATLDLVKAGQSFDSAQSILPAAADLASLSDSGSIENATGFIIQATSAFKQFNDTVPAGFENAATAVNIVSAAADTSVASVESLQQGLVSVGPIASSFGLSLQDTTAILGIFANGGLQGAEAGTQLKSILSSFTTATAQKELKRLGVSLTDTAGNFRPMNDVLNDINKKFTQTGTVSYKVTKQLAGPDADRLKLAQNALASATRQQFLIGNDLNATGLGKGADKAMQNAQTVAENATKIITEITGSAAETETITRNIQRTEKQNAESLKKIAGSYGQAGLAILLATGDNGLQNFVDQMNEVAPASERAKQALDNISGDVIQFQGSVETLSTKALLPLLNKFFRPFVKIGRFFVDSILSMNEGVIDFISTAVTLGSALITAVGGLAVITGAIIEFGGAVLGAFAFLATSAIPVIVTGFFAGLVGFAVGIAALTASILTLAPILTVITGAFNTLYAVFDTNAGGAADQLQHFAEGVVSAMTEVAGAIGNVIDFVVAVISGGKFTSLDTIGKGIASFFNELSLQVTKFRTSGVGKTLTDIGDIFKAFTQALTFDAGSQQAADNAVGAIDNVNEGFAGKKARTGQKARKEYLHSYEKFILDLLKNNKLLSSIFGGNVNLFNIEQFLNNATRIVGQVRDKIGNVFGSFGSAFKSAQDVFKSTSGNFGAAINTFFSTLRSNLDNTLGKLAGTILNGIGELFHLNTKELANVFNVKGFSAGISKLIEKAILGIRDFLVSNRGSIKDLFTGIFDFFILGGLNQAANLLKTIGAGPLADILTGVGDFFRTLFGQVFDTIFNLLAGQDISTALLNAFGPGIKPLLDLGASLGKAVDLIGKSIGKLFEAIFGPPQAVDPNAEPVLLTIFNGIVSGITGFLDFLNNNVLNYLSQGDVAGFVTNIATHLNDLLAGIDFLATFTNVATTISNGLINAVKDGFTGLANLLGFDASGFTADLDQIVADNITALGTGDLFTIAKNALKAAAVIAFEGIFDLVAGVLNVDPQPVLDKINGAINDVIDAISALFDSETFTNIKTIVDNVVSAFKSLFGITGTTEATDFQASGPTLTTILGNLFNMLGTLTAGVVGTIADLAKGLNDLVAALAKLSPGQLLGITGALGVFLLYATGGSVIGLLATAFTALQTAISGVASSFLAKAGAFVVIIEFIRAIAQNLDKFKAAIDSLSKGDLAGVFRNAIQGIINVFVDLGFNLLELLGIDKIFGQSREEFTRVANIMGALFGNAAQLAGSTIKRLIFDPIDTFLHVTVPLMLSELTKLGLVAKAATGDTTAQGTLSSFNTIDSVAGGNFDFKNSTMDVSNFISQVTDSALGGGRASIDRFTAQSARDFAASYKNALADYTSETDPEAQKKILFNIVRYFDLGGQGGNLLSEAAKSGNTQFLQTLVQGMIDAGITITPEMQAKLGNDIAAGFDLTNTDAAKVKLNQLDVAIETLKAQHLDTTQLQEIRDGLQAQIDAFIGAGDTPPLEVRTDVKAKVDKVLPPDPTDVKTGLENSTGGALPGGSSNGAGASGLDVELPVNIRPKFGFLPSADGSTPESKLRDALSTLPGATGTGGITGFDTATLGDPAAVQNFDTLVTTLATDVVSLAADLNGLPATQGLVTAALDEIQTSITAFRDTTVPMFGEVKLAIDPIQLGIDGINASLITMFATAAVGFPSLAITALSSILVMVTQFSMLRTAAETSLQTVISKVLDMASAFVSAAKAAKDLTLATGGTPPTGNNPPIGPGRAEGGSIFPGKLYPFLEKGLPEMVQVGAKTFLATAVAGKVTPMQPMSANRSTGLYGGAAAKPAAAASSTNTGTSVTIVEGAVQVSINGARVANEAQLVDKVVKAISSESAKRNQKLSDRLRTNHR